MWLFTQTKPVVFEVKQWLCGTGRTSNYLVVIPELEIKVRNGFFQSLKKKSHWVRTLAGANKGSLVAPVSSPGSRCWQREVGKGFWGVRAEKQKGGKPSDPGFILTKALSKWEVLRLVSTGVPSLVEIAGPWLPPASVTAGSCPGKCQPSLQSPEWPGQVWGEHMIALWEHHPASSILLDPIPSPFWGSLCFPSQAPQIFLDLHLLPIPRKSRSSSHFLMQSTSVW